LAATSALGSWWWYRTLATTSHLGAGLVVVVLHPAPRRWARGGGAAPWRPLNTSALGSWWWYRTMATTSHLGAELVVVVLHPGDN